MRRIKLSDERTIVVTERAADTRLAAEAEALEREPDPQEVAAQRLEKRLVALAARLDFNAGAVVHEDPRYQRRLLVPAPGSLSTGRQMSPEEFALAVLAKLDLVGLVAWGKAELERFYAAMPAGASGEERPARLATITRDRAASRCREEAAIRRAALRGETIERCPDAAPAYVLAPDEDLAREVEPSRIDVERYWDLRARGVARHVALREADNRRQIAVIEHERSVERLRHAEETTTGDGIEVAEELRAFEARRREVRERLQRIYAARHADWERAARLAIACREYAEEQDIDVRESVELSPVAVTA